VNTAAVLSLGSNLGDREGTIRDAVRAIASEPGIEVVAASGLVETAALKLHGEDATAPAYLNAAVIIRTELTPDALLSALAAIELAFGRVREERWGDRTLDVDIVTMGDLILDTERLTLPHPRAAERAFVLAPWLDIDPDAVLPGRGRVDELLAATGQSVRRYAAGGIL
jgi:2-amino-4-hydroxy-6-hydroxymethyldihydropteridine diphosphokinase